VGIEQVLEELRVNRGTFPHEAVQAAVQKREEIVPHLLDIVKYTTANAEALRGDATYFAHFYAMFLLAQFRETRACPLLVEFFSLPRDVTRDLTGDIATEDLPSMLASVCGGDSSLIKLLAEDVNANEFIRGSALTAILAMVASDQLTREEAVGYYRSLLKGRLEREHSQVWNSLAACCADLCAEEVIDEIRRAYDEGLVDPGYCTLEEIERDIAHGREAALNRLRRNSHLQLVDDTIKEMERWDCFRQEGGKPAARPEADTEIGPFQDTEAVHSGEGTVGLPEPPEAMRRKQATVGRNQPCPCGSGKKYKKCCGTT